MFLNERYGLIAVRYTDWYVEVLGAGQRLLK
jgi:hypothetical protein